MKTSQLHQRHPLASKDLELRLQYLAALALLMAIDRNPTPDEQQAFLGLAHSLCIDEAEAQE